MQKENSVLLFRYAEILVYLKSKVFLYYDLCNFFNPFVFSFHENLIA